MVGIEIADMARAETPSAFERRLKRERVHDRRQHAHRVGGGAVDPSGGAHARAAEDVAAADHHGDLDAGFGRAGHVAGERGEGLGVMPITVRRGQRLAGQLHEHAPVGV